MPFLDSMITSVRNLLGTSNEAVLRAYLPIVKAVNALEETIKNEDDAALVARSEALRKRGKEGAPLDEIQAEAFALAREAADRRLGMWKAILFPELGFEDWGTYHAEVEAARARIAAGEPSDKILLPARLYDQIRTKHPSSVPPFRMRAHDVQITGAAVLHSGRIAEMKTGEGKTLVAVIACYLNSLSGRAVHVVTVNDYLARRDATENAPVLTFLGTSVSAIQSDQSPEIRKGVYACDVVYGTNNEFGFDYLRDNLKQQLDQQVQTRRHYAIVDEVDSVLIDEARTPLIISGPTESHEVWFHKANEVALQLQPEKHFAIDIKDRHVTLSEEGIDEAAKLFGVGNLYASDFMHLPHFLDNALKALHLYTKDKEYLVVDGEVKIVDEFTGRVLAGRRWSDGLHQAIEAKEGTKIQEETQTYATITLQNFFRLYDKLAGMTGTAMTEADEFHAIYKLQTVAIPPNRPMIRRDLADLIYGSTKEKFDAIVEEVSQLHAIGQPMLVGTISVEVSEKLSELLKRKGIKHNVLNARQHQREAEIITEAGQLGGVTIATNMAGRGTDIKLGKASFPDLIKHWKANDLAPKRMDHTATDRDLDAACLDMWAKRFLGEKDAATLHGQDPDRILTILNKERHQRGWYPLQLPSAFKNGIRVQDLGGLRIIGTERHEARRIDNQLRGRSGRQGDPGSSRFFLCLDDDLMKRFAGPMMANMMRKLGLKDGMPIESRMVSNAVEKAQKRVEEYHFGIRKNLLEYDQVMNLQRTQVYRERQRILEGDEPVLEETLVKHYTAALDDLVQDCATDGTRGPALAKRIDEKFAEIVSLPAPGADNIPIAKGGEACRDFLIQKVREGLLARKEMYNEAHAYILRMVLLETIDRRWKDHLYSMDHLRHGIGLEGYGQRDPRMRYKEEGFKYFQGMWLHIRNDITGAFFRLQIQVNRPPVEELPSAEASLLAGGFTPVGQGDGSIHPNAPCPCGSGRPYGSCHG